MKRLPSELVMTTRDRGLAASFSINLEATINDFLLKCDVTISTRQYVAIDGNGSAYVYEKKPSPSTGGHAIWISGGDKKDGRPDHIFLGNVFAEGYTSRMIQGWDRLVFKVGLSKKEEIIADQREKILRYEIDLRTASSLISTLLGKIEKIGGIVRE